MPYQRKSAPPAPSGWDELSAAAKRGEAAGVYLFAGPEAFLMRQAERLLADWAGNCLRLDDITGDEGWDRFVTAAGAPAPGMFAAPAESVTGRRAVIVRDDALLKLKAEGGLYTALEAVLADARADGGLALVFSFVGDDDAGELGKLAGKYGSVLRFERMEPGRLNSWARRYADSRGLRIGSERAAQAVERCECDMRRLAGALDALAMFVEAQKARDPGYELADADFDKLMQPVGGVEDFALSNAVRTRDRLGARRVLAEMQYQREQPSGALFAIAGTVVELQLGQAGYAARYTPDHLSEQTGIHSYRVKLAMEARARWSRADLDRAVTACREADEGLKTSRADGWVLMEQLLTEIM